MKNPAKLSTFAAFIATAVFLIATPDLLADNLPAGSFSVTVWNGTYSSGVTDMANIGSEPSIPSTATFTYNGALDFSNSNPANTFSDFGFSSGNISNFASAETESNFLATVMSTAGETGSAINTYMLITAAYTTQSSSSVEATLSSDDGSSLYYFNGSSWVTSISSPSPQSLTSTSGSIMGGTDVPFEITYVESNGAPADLSFSTSAPVAITPEPAALLLMGSGMLMIGLISLKRLHAGESC